jgi:hypothetical protein
MGWMVHSMYVDELGLQRKDIYFKYRLAVWHKKYLVWISVLRVIFGYEYIESEVLSVKIELMDYIVVPTITFIN